MAVHLGEEAAVAKGSDTGDGLTCPRDKIPTRLRCTDCRTPICPSCFVRTPVGLKCDTCAAPVPAAVALARRPRRAVLAAGATVAVLAVVGGGWALFGRSGGGDAGDPLYIDGATGVVPIDTPAGDVVATGRTPEGRSWAIEARRDERGQLCAKLTSPGTTGVRESCEAVPSSRAFGTVRSRGTIRPGGPTFQTWGIVSERVVRVQVTAEDGTVTEAELLGDGAGLGVRFFMSYVDRLGATTLVAFGADGAELGRVDPPVIPPPPAR